MDQSPSWEANSSLRSAIQEIPRLLWNPKFHYIDHKFTTGPYSEPYKSNPHPPNLFP
jgi:hypothetical protein